MKHYKDLSKVKQAIHDATNERRRVLLAEADNYSITTEMNSRWLELIKHNSSALSNNKKNFKNTLKWIARSVVMASLLLIFLYQTIPSFGDWFTRLIIDSNQNYATYYLESIYQQDHEQTEFLEHNTIGLYRFQFVPSGFTLHNYNYENGNETYAFQNDRNQTITIEIVNLGEKLTIDYSKAEEVVKTKVKNFDATFTSVNGINQIIWADSDQLILVTTRLSKETTFKIAEGIKKKEK